MNYVSTRSEFASPFFSQDVFPPFFPALERDFGTTTPESRPLFLMNGPQLPAPSDSFLVYKETPFLYVFPFFYETP